MNPTRCPSVSARRTAEREHAVVIAAQAGDEQAFALLVDRYGQPILSLCYASTLDPWAADDLAQEIFVAAWRGLGGFRGDSAFSTWLFALARNRCIDRARRAAVRPRLASACEAADEIDPYDHSVQQLAAAVFEAAAQLSLPLRQALLLRDIQGLAYEEIATLQEVPVGTVRSRISAARAAVAAEIE